MMIFRDAQCFPAVHKIHQITNQKSFQPMKGFLF